MIKNMIKKYIEARKINFAISNVKNTGVLMIAQADKLGNSSIIKPSNYKVQYFMDKCADAKMRLVRVINSKAWLEDFGVSIDEQLIKDITDLEIKELLDCKKLGDYYLKIGGLLAQSKKYNVFLMPMGKTLPFKTNVLEMMVFNFIFTGVVFVIFKIHS